MIREWFFLINVNSHINIVQLVHNLEKILAKINLRNYNFRLESMNSSVFRFHSAFKDPK